MAVSFTNQIVLGAAAVPGDYDILDAITGTTLTVQEGNHYRLSNATSCACDLSGLDVERTAKIEAIAVPSGSYTLTVPTNAFLNEVQELGGGEATLTLGKFIGAAVIVTRIDSTDYTAEGAILGAERDLSQAALRNYADKIQALAATSGAISQPFGSGGIVTGTLTGNATSLALTDMPVGANILFAVNLAGFTWSHPSGITWPDATPPSLGTGQLLVGYLKIAATPTYRGLFVGKGFA